MGSLLVAGTSSKDVCVDIVLVLRERLSKHAAKFLQLLVESLVIAPRGTRVKDLGRYAGNLCWDIESKHLEALGRSVGELAVVTVRDGEGRELV